MGITNSEKYNTELFEYLSRTNNTFAMCGCFKGDIDEKGFDNILKKYLINDYTYYFTNNFTVINIIKNKNLLGTIIGHEGGDTRTGYNSYFKIDLCIVGKKGFYKGKNIGILHNEDKYMFKDGYLYTLTELGLTKYDLNGNVMWNNKLKYRKDANRIITRFGFYSSYSRPNKSFPNNLIAIENGECVEYYSESKGKFFDRLYLRLRRDSSYELYY